MHAAITHHLELLDLARMPERILESMITRMKSAPKLPEGLIGRIRAAAKAAPAQDMLIRFVAARLEEAKIDVQELETVNEFYASPLGRKYAATQPAIVQGSGDFLQTWATQLSIQASDAGLRNVPSQDEKQPIGSTRQPADSRHMPHPESRGK